MRTSKIIIGIMLGALAVLGCGAFGADQSSTPATAVVVQPQFENFDPATYKGETGTIALPCAGQSMLLLRKFEDGKLGNYLELSGKEKSVSVPVGTYKVQYCSLQMPAKNGTTWGLNASGDTGDKAKPFEVKAGKSVKLPFAEAIVKSLKSGKTGTMTLPSNGESMAVLVGANGGMPSSSLQVTGKSKTLTAPVGSYKLAYCRYMAADKAGAKWAITSSAPSEAKAKTVNIKPNANVSIGSCGLVTASIDVNQAGDKVNMSLKMTAADGTNCTVMRADGKGDPPSFKVLSESGEVLMSGKFAYG